MNKFYFCYLIDIFAVAISLLFLGLMSTEFDNKGELILEEREKTSVLIESKENFTRYGNPVYILIYYDNATGEYWERKVDADTYYKQKNENKMEIENGTE